MTYLISLILLLLPSYLIRFSIFGIPTTLLEVLIYLVFFYGLYRARKIGFRNIPAKIYLPIGLLIVALIIATIISPDKRTALGEFKGFFIDPILVFWLIYQFIKKEDLPKIFWALILAGLFVAAHTIVQKILGHITEDGRVIGIFGFSPNYLALFLAPVAVLTASLLFTDYRLPSLKNKYLHFAVVGSLLAVSLVAIYFSGSRGGFLAIAAGLGVFLIAQYWSWIQKRLSAKIIVVILIVVASYTGWTFLRPDFSAETIGGRTVTSNNIRWEIWRTSLELGSKHPILGVGLGNFQNAFDELTRNRVNFPEYITPMALTPHNLFLMFWLSTGILGLVAFLWLLVSFYRQVLRNFKEEFSPIVFAVMFSIVIYGLIEASIWKNDLSIIFWAIWGMIWIL